MMQRTSAGERRPWRARAFTLIEMLVSVAVLALVLLLVSQMINNAEAVVANSGKHVDTDTEARVIFNRLGIELGAMVKRPEVDYSDFKQPLPTLPVQYSSVHVQANPQVGNDQLAFYTETAGYGNSGLVGPYKANVSLVAYQVANDPYSTGTGAPALQRMSQQLGWEPGSGASGSWNGIVYLPISMTDQWGNLFGTAYASNYEVVGDQVFRMEYTYLLKPITTGSSTVSSSYSITPWWNPNNGVTPGNAVPPAHTWINGFTDVASIVVTLALLDSRSRATVHDYTKLTAPTLLPDAVDPIHDSQYHGDIAPAWNAVITASNFASQAGIPQSAAAAVRVYERSFPLDTQP